MTQGDIARIVDEFAAAAARAQRAGLDGVEIHAGHGYLISAFLSPASNRRTDEYGGPLENRARLMVEVLQAARDRVGSDFPHLGPARFPSNTDRRRDHVRPCSSHGRDRRGSRGQRDPRECSREPRLRSRIHRGPRGPPPRSFVAFAEGIKRRVRIPVIAVGRISPEHGRTAAGHGQGRLHRDGPQTARRSRSAQQALLRGVREHPTLHLSLQVHRPDLSPLPSALRGQSGYGERARVRLGPTEAPRKLLVAVRPGWIGSCPNRGLSRAPGGPVRGLAMHSAASSPWPHARTNPTRSFCPGWNARRRPIPSSCGSMPRSRQSLRLRWAPKSLSWRWVAAGSVPSYRAPMLTTFGASTKSPVCCEKTTVDRRTGSDSRRGSSGGRNRRIVGGSWTPRDVIEESECLVPQMGLPGRWRILHELSEKGVEWLRSIQVESIAQDAVNCTGPIRSANESRRIPCS